MPEAGILTALRHVASIAIHPQGQAVTAPVLTVQRIGSLPPVHTAPVVAVQEPMAVMVPTVVIPAVLAITTAPAPVLAAIQLPHRKRVQLRHLQETLVVTEQ